MRLTYNKAGNLDKFSDWKVHVTKFTDDKTSKDTFNHAYRNSTMNKAQITIFCLSLQVALTGLIPATCLFPNAISADTAQYFYDDLGRLQTMQDTAGNVAVYAYDAVGNVSSIARFTPPGSGIGIYVLAPSSGVNPNQVTILGYGYSATPANNTVKFNCTPHT